MTQSIGRRGLLTGAAAACACAALPARAAPAQGSPPQGRLVDVHHHYFPPAYLAARAKEVAARSRGSEQVLQWTPEKSLADMDAGGTATAILSMSAPLWFGDAAEARALAAEANAYAQSLVKAHPGRFGWFASLPMPDAAGAVVEATKALDAGAQGVAILSNYDGKYLGEPAFAPLLDALNARGAVAYVHPTVAPCCQALLPEVAPAFLELPFDTTRTIGSLLYGGALGRYPRIRWIFSHGGGTLPFLADRLSQWARARPDLAAQMPGGPLALLRRLNFDTASVTNAPALAAIGAFVPWSQLLFGTDYPYVATAPQRMALRGAGLPADAIGEIEHAAADRLLHLA